VCWGSFVSVTSSSQLGTLTIHAVSEVIFRGIRISGIAGEAANRGGLDSKELTRCVSYWGKPSTAKARNFAYLSPILRASLYSAES
jgi:hypothetical protein